MYSQLSNVCNSTVQSWLQSSRLKLKWKLNTHINQIWTGHETRNERTLQHSITKSSLNSSSSINRATSDTINTLSTISNLFSLKLTFRCHLTPSSELRMSRLFSMKCRFRGNELTHEEETCQNWLTGSTTRCHGNDTSRRRVDSFSVLRKVSDDTETSTLN